MSAGPGHLLDGEAEVQPRPGGPGEVGGHPATQLPQGRAGQQPQHLGQSTAFPIFGFQFFYDLVVLCLWYNTHCFW